MPPRSNRKDEGDLGEGDQLSTDRETATESDGVPERSLTSGAHKDFPLFASRNLRIQTKGGRFEPLDLNPPQQIRWKLICDIRAKGEPVRIWEAKARQTGGSTFVQALLFHTCVTTYVETALVVAHNADTVHEVFTKAKLFHAHLPTSIKPATKYDNRTALDFRSPRGAGGLRSRLSVVLPRDATSANGITARHVHVSEIALYSKPDGFMLNMLQTVPDSVDSTVYVESTCEGSGDYHHEQYLLAKVFWEDPPPWMELKRQYPGSPDSQWYALFTPWFLMPEYRAALKVPEAQFRATLDRDELDLLDRFGDWVTLENIQWRRQTIQSKCGGHVTGFRQQYPSTDTEAFASTGRPVFDADDIAWQEQMHVCACEVCRPHPEFRPDEKNDCPEHEWYEISDGTGWSPNSGERLWTSYKPELTPAPAGLGRLSIWKHPEPRRSYILIADVAAGGDTGDWDHVTILDDRTLEQVAVWRGKVDMMEYADVLMLLAVFYNKALLVPEATGIGYGLVAMLERTRYWRLYRRPTLNQVGLAVTSVLGWSTTASSKSAAVGLLTKSLRERYAKIRDRTTLDELRAFRATVVEGDGEGVKMSKMGAPAGKNDDAAMTMIIGAAVGHYQGRLTKHTEASNEPTPWDSSTWTQDWWDKCADENGASDLRRRGYRRQ